MSKPITLTEGQWAKIYQQLAKDNPHSVIIIREKMKQVLGFTVRRHQEWNENNWDYKHTICLDFYNEPKRTLFLLKYSEYLDKPE